MSYSSDVGGVSLTLVRTRCRRQVKLRVSCLLLLLRGIHGNSGAAGVRSRRAVLIQRYSRPNVEQATFLRLVLHFRCILLDVRDADRDVGFIEALLLQDACALLPRTLERARL